MTEQEAIAALDAIDGTDPEQEHSDADKWLLEFVPREVADAWRRANLRSGFWYA